MIGPEDEFDYLSVDLNDISYFQDDLDDPDGIV